MNEDCDNILETLCKGRARHEHHLHPGNHDDSFRAGPIFPSTEYPFNETLFIPRDGVVCG